MSTVVSLHPRTERVTALLLEDGVTSAAEIEQFCGQVPVNVGRATSNDRDLRWVQVTTPTGPADAGYGDWLVKLAPTVVLVVPSDALLAVFAPEGTGDAERLRRAHRPNPALEVATQLARSLRSS